MSDVQCKKNHNEVIPVSIATANHFALDSVCHSCLNFDICREEFEIKEFDVFSDPEFKADCERDQIEYEAREEEEQNDIEEA